MKTRYLLTLIILTVFVIVSSYTLISQEMNLKILPSDDLKTILEKTVSSHQIPGIVAAIVDSSEALQIESAGIRKVKSPELLTTQDKLHLGSCTKAMTSAMIAILVDEGLLTWQSSIGEIFNELKDSIHIDYHDVTLHQLVRHRGGIIDNAANWWSYSDLEKDKTRRKEIKDRRVAILVDNLKNAPKQKQGEFLYSNLGYMIAGSMAAKVTGLTWEQLMKQKLFEPLDMKSAGFGFPGTKDKTDQPWGHSTSWFTGQSPSQGDNAEALGPAGTVHCTIEDWSKFVSWLFLKKDQSLLTKEQIKTLKTPIGEYAAGWNKIERPWAQGYAYTHSGSNTMWLSIAWVAPELGKAYLVVTNSFDKLTHEICDGVIGHMLRLDGAIEKK